MQINPNLSFIALKVLSSPRKQLNPVKTYVFLCILTFKKCPFSWRVSPNICPNVVAWVTHSLVFSLSEYKGVCADIWTFETLRKWKQSQNNSDLWKDANVRWMGRKWEKRQEGFNEKTINFREVLLKSATFGIFPGVYLHLGEKLRGLIMNCWAANYSVIVTWVSLGSSPHLPPSCSNSVTSLLPNSYPPWWFPMGLHLIQLSEHTHTICFEVFFLNHWHDSSAASLGKRTVAKFSHFPENTLVTFWIWNRPSGKTCGETSALPKQELGGERELRWTKPRVNEERERGEGQKGKAVKRRVE